MSSAVERFTAAVQKKRKGQCSGCYDAKRHLSRPITARPSGDVALRRRDEAAGDQAEISPLVSVTLPTHSSAVVSTATLKVFRRTRRILNEVPMLRALDAPIIGVTSHLGRIFVRSTVVIQITPPFVVRCQ
ncbi:hypothetical protein J6590_066445 [Homalodisca vitripennis]|nr:hypothetical protein J6590_066445 [Homalodisca vitripennis]